MTRRLSALALFLTLCSATAAAPKKQPFYDRFHDLQNDFAAAHNEWGKLAGSLSPASPDYRERLREAWHTREIGEKFRRLERLLAAP